MPPKKKDPFRVELSRLAGKIAAYQKLGDIASAKHWACELQSYLIRTGLLIDNTPRLNHNGTQFAKTNKANTETVR